MYIYLESTRWELSNGMLHYAESMSCQKLQSRRFIPKRYLDVNILGSTNAKQLGKSFLFIYYVMAIDLYILFTLISNFNFWYFNVRKWVLMFSRDLLEMIRLFNSKRNKFWPMKPYIFGKYSLRAFQRCVKQWLYSVYFARYKQRLIFRSRPSVVNIFQ